MDKYNRLLKDTALFTLSSFGSKILSILLIPLYTSILSTEEYGIADMIVTTVSLTLPLFTFSIYEAILRFSFDKGIKGRQLLTISGIIILMGILVSALLSPLIGSLLESLQPYMSYYVVIHGLTAIETCFANYVKGKVKTTIFAISGIIHTFVYLLTNVVLLVWIRTGLVGYLWSYIIASSVSIIYILIAGRLMKDIFPPQYSGPLAKEMLLYSIPMIPTSIAWWINTSVDKYMLTSLCGVSVTGMYSVAHKIPLILTTISGIFIQAWQISAIANYKQANYDEFFTRIYRCLMLFSTYLCMVLILLNRFISGFMFSDEFAEAWIYVPSLLISSLFSTYSGFLASAYVSAKKTNVLFISTCVGAIINILLNYVLIRTVGAIGSAYATLISFMIVYFVRSLLMTKIVKIKINHWVTVLTIILLIAQSIIASYNINHGTALLLCVTAAICLLILKDTAIFGSVCLKYVKKILIRRSRVC